MNHLSETFEMITSEYWWDEVRETTVFSVSI